MSVNRTTGWLIAVIALAAGWVFTHGARGVAAGSAPADAGDVVVGVTEWQSCEVSPLLSSFGCPPTDPPSLPPIDGFVTSPECPLGSTWRIDVVLGDVCSCVFDGTCVRCGDPDGLYILSGGSYHWMQPLQLSYSGLVLGRTYRVAAWGFQSIRLDASCAN